MLFIYLPTFFILMMYLLPLSLEAKTWVICETCEISSIKAAISQAQAHDTLQIKAGTYHEFGIEINKPITLIGEGFPIVDGDNQGEIFLIRADSVHISGFQIQNVGTSYTEDQAGIRVENASHCTITNNRLYNTFFGIYLAHVKHSKVIDNEVVGEAEQEVSSGNAIHLWYCNHIEIRDNLAKNHRDGIYFEFVDSSKIYHNQSENNLRYGLHFMFSDENEYFRNIFQKNGAGVAVMFSHKIKMEENRFIQNWGSTSYGLLLKEIYDSEIVNNVFEKNTVAIYAESATRVEIKDNDFVQNGWALKILGSCMDDRIERNNFMGNTFDVATNSARNYNVYKGNFWSEYTGYDLNRDGTGDVPYRPVKLYSFLVSKSAASLILLRSLFIDILSFTEKIIPMLTPETLVDEQPVMKKIIRKYQVQETISNSKCPELALHT